MWVQLISTQYLDLDGAQKTYRPGDWVDVGKQTALRWIAEGAARLVSDEKITIAPGAGVVVVDSGPGAIDRLQNYGLDLPAQLGPPHVPYPRTLIWDGRLFLRLDLLAAGFAFLERWEIAIPLADYDMLAADIGTPDQRAYAEGIVRDLRVPVYDPRLMFMRQGAAAGAVLDRYADERERRGLDERLALLIALYTARPLLLALPTTWLGRDRR